MDSPEWVRQTEKLLPVLVDVVQAELGELPHITDSHLSMLPYCAGLHWYSALKSSIEINLKGYHAIAICLLRQALEAQSIVALGLSKSEDSLRLLERWNSRNASHGEIRKHLEQQVWPHFPHRGLWKETWAEYYSSINRAVQDYAHYTPSLLGWQWRDIGPADEPLARMQAIGISAYDPLKASRITGFHSILTWTMATVIFNFMGPEPLAGRDVLSKPLRLLEQSLSQCKLLWPKTQWEAQFAADMFIEGAINDYLLE